MDRRWLAAGKSSSGNGAGAESSIGQDEPLRVLDVRREGEWSAGRVEGASWHALDNFKHALPELTSDAPVAVHCKGGYRSMIACSFLQRAGHRNVVNVVGGFDAWEKAGLPVVSQPVASAKA